MIFQPPLAVMKCLSLPSKWWRLPLFALLLLLPLAMGEAYVRSLPNPAKFKHAYLSRHAREVEVLVMGSSHTYYGLCPERLGPHAFSAAQTSQTLKYDDYLLHHYPFESLRTVVLPISDFTFYEELEEGAGWSWANRYRLYMDCDIHPRFSVYDWECTAFRPFCEKLKSLWQPPQMQWSATGQGLEYRIDRRSPDWDEGGTAALRNRYTDFSSAARQLAHLESIALYCRAHRARLWLISTPLRPSYRAAILPLQEADMQQRLRRFLHRHPEVRYADFRADADFTAADFYDSDHLNLDGARKLSDKLRRLLEQD